MLPVDRSSDDHNHSYGPSDGPLTVVREVEQGPGIFSTVNYLGAVEP